MFFIFSTTKSQSTHTDVSHQLPSLCVVTQSSESSQFARWMILAVNVQTVCFCVLDRNVWWNLRWQLSVVRTRTRRSTNSESLRVDLSLKTRWTAFHVFLRPLCRSSVRLTIRKIQFSPEDSKLLPSAETTFEFLMSEKPLHVKLSLPKEVRASVRFWIRHQNHQVLKAGGLSQIYSWKHFTCLLTCLQTFYHGEPLKANVEITNSSSRNIKDISLSGDISLASEYLRWRRAACLCHQASFLQFFLL